MTDIFLPSEKLFSAVMGVECFDIWFGDKRYFYYSRKGKTDINGKPFIYDINIYEFSFLCKMWAIEYHYRISTKIDSYPIVDQKTCEVIGRKTYADYSIGLGCRHSIHTDTLETENEALQEVYATIEACKWILKQNTLNALKNNMKNNLKEPKETNKELENDYEPSDSVFSYFSSEV